VCDIEPENWVLRNFRAAILMCGEVPVAVADRSWLVHTFGASPGNLRAGLQWAVEQGDTSTALRLGGALSDFWWARGAQSESRDYFDALLRLSAVRPGVPEQSQEWASLRTQVLGGAMHMAWARGDFALATQYAEERLALDYELEDTAGIAFGLGALGVLALWQGDEARAAALLSEGLALARGVELRQELPWMLISLGELAWHQGDYVQAVALLSESLALAQENKDQIFIAWSLRHLGTVACLQGDFVQAIDLLSKSLMLYRNSDDVWGVVECMEIYAWVAIGQSMQIPQQRAGDIPPALVRAARLLGAAAALRSATGHPSVAGCHAIHQRKVSAIRAAMGEAALVAAWAEGCAMTVEQAIAHALEGSDGDHYPYASS
jgi:tetratricopeptide (TPR) repeat protein